MEEQKTKEQWAIENAALIKERDQLSNACTYLMSELHLSQQEAGQKAAQVILLKTQKAQIARETADALNALEADLRQRETIIVDLANKLEHQQRMKELPVLKDADSFQSLAGKSDKAEDVDGQESAKNAALVSRIQELEEEVAALRAAAAAAAAAVAVATVAAADTTDTTEADTGYI